MDFYRYLVRTHTLIILLHLAARPDTHHKNFWYSILSIAMSEYVLYLLCEITFRLCKNIFWRFKIETTVNTMRILDTLRKFPVLVCSWLIIVQEPPLIKFKFDNRICILWSNIFSTFICILIWDEHGNIKHWKGYDLGDCCNGFIFSWLIFGTSVLKR
jgi:hypothetical protein